MANAFLKAEKIVSQGLGLLQRELILAALVTRYGVSDFAGAKNDTINIRIPAILKGREYEWRTRTGAIVTDELDEVTIAVTLDSHLYSAVGITDEELTLDIVDWGSQVARPQIRAVAEKIEGTLANAMENANFAHSVPYTPDPTDDTDRSFYKAAVAARKELNNENVPKDGRVILVGADVEEQALLSPHLVKVDQAGSDSALREAVLGRIAGFTVVGSNSVDPEFATAFHQTAFALGNVAPVVPSGAKAGGGLVYEGLAMRWIRDYDSDHLRDRSVYSAFAGAASVEDGRDLAATGSGYGALTGENVRAVEIAFTAP